MERFEYEAMTAGGRVMTGTLQADSLQEAQDLLAGMQLSVGSIRKAPRPRPRTRLGRSEFLLFNQQLASITQAGIPLERALRELSGDVQSAPLRRAVEQLADDLERGTPVETAFQRHQQYFPHLYGQIIKAGVQSGRLSEMLISLNRHLEMAGQTRRILVDALSYPVFVLLLATGILTVLLAYIVPQFKAFFADMGHHLPAMTSALIWLGDHVVHIWAGIGAVIVVLFAGRFLMRLRPDGRRALERMLLRTPLLGRLYHRTILARLADAMAILVGAHCDLPTALRLGAGASGSENLIHECEALARQTEEGQSALDTDRFLPTIPRLMLYSIHLGSERNELEDNLYQLAEAYRTQARQWQGTLQTLLTPMLLVAVGGVMAFVLTALFMPMAAMINAVQTH
ncbi:MAG TPA: type II secretion system F family protein [Phycisphaerae bacterium]|nr:type II secretion system F family protein [Phycisphaerae bacterium]